MAIEDYVYSRCMNVVGRYISLRYSEVVEKLSDKLKQIGLSERQFRHIWKQFLDMISGFIVYRDRHRGVTVVSVELCRAIQVKRVVSLIASEKLSQIETAVPEVERLLDVEYWRDKLIDCILSGSSCSDIYS